MVKRVYFGLVWLVGMMAAPAMAASFDCSKAMKPHEKVICADQALSSADETLAKDYARLMAELPAALKPALQKSQRSWIAYAPLACSSDGKGTIKDQSDFAQCLKMQYDNRIRVLAQQPQNIGPFKALALAEFQAMRSSSDDLEFFPVVTHEKSVTSIYGGDEASATQLNQWLQSLASKETAGWNDPEVSASFTLSLEQANTLFASALINQEVFGVGAAHPVTLLSMAHLNRQTGKPLLFRDVFQNNARAKLLALTWTALKKKLGNDRLVEKPAEIAKLVEDPGHWHFGRDGLTIQFNVYEVAAYVMGPQDVLLPWSVLQPLLTPFGQSIPTEIR